MNRRHLLIAFFTFFSVHSAGASALGMYAENWKFKALCGLYRNECKSNPKGLPAPIQTALSGCEMQVKSPICTELGKDPEFTEHLRKCDASSFCEDQTQMEMIAVGGCKDGFLYGTGEVFDMVQVAFEKWKAQANQRQETRTEFIKICDQSVACKRELVSDIPKFQKMPEATLNKYSTSALWVERQNFDYIQAKQKQHSSTTDRSAYQKAEYSESLGKSLADTKALMTAANEMLNKRKEELACLDVETRSMMLCWGAAYIVDPFLITKGAKAGARGAKLFAKWIAPETAPKLTSLAAAKATGAATRGSVSTQEARELFQKIKDSLDLPFCSIGGACESRTHIVAKYLDDVGVDSEKITAYSTERDSLVVNLNRSGTMDNRSVHPWNFHTANLVRVRTADGKVVEQIFDPSLFKEPVDRKVWEAKVKERDPSVEFKITDKHQFLPGKDAPAIWDPNDFAEADKIIRTYSHPQQIYESRQTILKGRWLDRLQVRDPQAFDGVSKALQNPEFKLWWDTPFNRQEYEALLQTNKQYIYNLDRQQLQQMMSNTVPNRTDAEIKIKTWQQVWRRIQEKQNLRPNYDPGL